MRAICMRRRECNQSGTPRAAGTAAGAPRDSRRAAARPLRGAAAIHAVAHHKKDRVLTLPYDARLVECPEVHEATRENSGEGETL